MEPDKLAPLLIGAHQEDTMAKLTYGMLASLDGYVQDSTGNFDWATPDDEVHAHANQEQLRVGTDIYGRKMYQMMVYWETADQLPDSSPVSVEFSKLWQAVDKIVVSSTLTEVRSKRTRLVPSLGADEVRKLKAESSKNISVSGPTLASSFLNAGLVDEVSVYYVPIVVGGGLPMFKDMKRQIRLERIEERAFAGGFTFIRYCVHND
jgi:dihydrofolate reductase